jgi:hypothetical protein
MGDAAPVTTELLPEPAPAPVPGVNPDKPYSTIKLVPVPPSNVMDAVLLVVRCAVMDTGTLHWQLADAANTTLTRTSR